jgi:hypothetical protein
MREELRVESSRGIALSGLTSGQRALSMALACLVTILLVVLPNLL